MKSAVNPPNTARFRRPAENSSFLCFSFQHFSFTQIPLSPRNPLFPTSGLAIGSFNGLHPKSNFLAIKLSWALRNRHDFPVNLQTATREILLRVPGLGVRNTDRILQIRRFTHIRLTDLTKLRVSLTKVLPFIITADHNPSTLLLDSDHLRARFLPKPVQLDLFAPNDKH